MRTTSSDRRVVSRAVLAVTALLFAANASAQTYHFSTLAGIPTSGTADGVGSAAQFNGPGGLVLDGTTIYAADRINHTIRKIAPGDIVTTLAGLGGTSGFVDNSGAAARFKTPSDIALGTNGILYVADTGNHAIRMVTTGGLVTTLAGSGVAGSADGTGAAAQFSSPGGLAVDANLNVYVADTGNHTIRMITPGGVVTTIAGSAGLAGSTNATGSAARFNAPFSLVLDDVGTAFVTEAGAHTIRQVTQGLVVTTVAGTAGVPGSTDGSGPAASFNGLRDIARDSAGNLYVAELNNHTIRKIAAGFVVTRLSGLTGQSGFVDGDIDTGRYNQPYGVAVRPDGSAVYASDGFNNAIRRVTSSGVVSTVAGVSPGVVNGTGSEARFQLPGGIAVNPTTGMVYVSAPNNQILRQVTGRGVTSTLAGLLDTVGVEDGTGSEARFSGPWNLAVDSTGNIIVADRPSHTIRKVTPAGVVTTLAGSPGVAGSTDGTGAAARFNFPTHVDVAPDDTIYVTDSNHTIRVVTQAGVVTTLAGTTGATGSTDGTGAAARFNAPSGLATDATYVYVADANNHTVRRVTRAGGVVTTLAGTSGSFGAIDGTGNAARFRNPLDLAIDSAGNLFVADYGNHVIRRVTPAGVVTTVAGLAGERGSTRGSGTTARFNLPAAIAIGKHDTLYVAEYGNSDVRLGVKATTNVVTNNSFASDATGWLQFGLPTLAAMVSNVTGGVFQFQRNGTQAVVFQETGLPLEANAPIEAQFQIGNSDTVRKRVSVLFHDSDFADLSVCTFFLPPNAPLQTYTMRSHTTKAWGSATISFYAATNGTGGFYRMDNVSVQLAPANSPAETRCLDPNPPTAPGGAAGANLLLNGDFSSAINSGSGWSTFGQITGGVTGGVFNFGKLAGTPAGVILQATNQPAAANEILTATFQLGNTASVRKRATAIIHDNSFGDLSACTFWLPPNQPLSSYAFRTYATQAWTNATLSVYPATVGTDQAIQLDNATLQRTPGTAIVGTECIEPSTASDAAARDARRAPVTFRWAGVAGSTATPSATPAVVAAPASAADISAEATRDAGAAIPIDEWLADGFVPTGETSPTNAGPSWVAAGTETTTHTLTRVPSIDLTSATSATLRFESWLSATSSRASVQVSVDGATWETIHVVTPPSDTWVPIEIDLGSYLGRTVHLRFVFDAVAPVDAAAPPDAWRLREATVD